MHDPMTVAHEIKYPWRAYPKAKRTDSFTRDYRRSFITIWHVDPERDGTDDSCGWFKRARHGDKAVMEKIRRAFDHEWDSEYGGWFNEDGSPRYSSMALGLMMFRRAAHTMFKSDWTRTDRFMRRHTHDILAFAENATDSMHDGFIQKYGPEKRDKRIERTASMVYGWILRAERPWYRHPRWHVWHWQIQVHPLQTFKRWAFSSCAGCGRRFRWGYSPVSHSWNGSGPRWFRSERGVYHGECSGAAVAKSAEVR